MQVACNKATTVPVINIKEVMDSWLNQNYYPILNVKQNEDRKIVEISAQTDISYIPVTYNTQTNINFENTLPNFWLKGQLQRQMSPFLPKKIFTFSNIKTDWIILNLQQTGKYFILKVQRKIGHENQCGSRYINKFSRL